MRAARFESGAADKPQPQSSRRQMVPAVFGGIRMSKLLIVESPAKAKTIGKYLGSDFVVKASMGHLRDLPKKEMGVDIEGDFTPKYQPIDGKDKIIHELKDAAQKSDFVYLATDPDREGEAISWHLKEMLHLADDKTQRVTFNEITKKAVTAGVQHPRDIDMNLVDAQQGRRILDRIVGYQLSPFLWRKVRSGLSAGRVQSVVTRLIVDREREIQAFIPQEYWSIAVTLNASNKNFNANFYGDEKGKLELGSEEETQKVLSAIDGQSYLVKTVKKAKKKRTPAPPFITSTLQQEASRKLSMTAKRTMMVAQELYEGVELEGMGLTGLITYMRTDSLRISEDALAAARSYIGDRFGQPYLPEKARHYKSKKNAQDAHEAVRPTNPLLDPDSIRRSLTPDQYKLYKLIWSRFTASQMTDAMLDTTSADIACGGYIFRATGQTVAFPGFLALYEEGLDEVSGDEDGAPLPVLQEGDKPEHRDTQAKQHFTQPPARYTEASLIRTMEEKGIGRPSTYAPTISVVLGRDYVVKEGKALKPTPLGEAVTDLMIDKFHDVIDVAFTAGMEQKLDEVESGKTDYREVLRRFYEGFSQELKQAEIDLDKKRIKVRDEETDVVCELCGRKMVIKSGRFGKFLACPGYPECKNTKPITEDTGVLCPLCGAKVVKRKSKSGYYYYGCEKNPTCTFMTWDKPTPNKQCPKCGEPLYKRYTKAEKKYVCYKPGCEYEEPLPQRRTKKKGEEAEEAAAAELTENVSDVPEKEAKKKTAAKKPAAKKPAAKTAKKTAAAAKTDETKKTARKPAAKTAKKESAAETEEKPAKAAKKPAAKTTKKAAAGKTESKAKKTAGKTKAKETEQE